MDQLEQIVEFRTSPELIAKLKQYSTEKMYREGEVILD